MATLLCESCDNLFTRESSFTIQKMNEYFSLYPSNRTAPDEDIPKLEMYLRQAKGEIKAYDTEIERIEGVLEELKNRRVILFQASARMSGMVRSSIRKLPLEILLSIFHIYCENADLPIRSIPMNHPALILGVVCSQWRTIVHSMPIFWSKIRTHYLFIHGTPGYIDYPVQTRRIARFILEKSKALPLDISLRSYSSREDAFVELAKQSRRWKTLELETFTDFTYFPVSFPNLETLSLRGRCWDWNGTLPAKVSTPSLRKLVSTGENLVIGTHLDTHSLEKLVVMNKVDFTSFSNVLRLSPSLFSLELSKITFHRLPANNHFSISIPITVLQISRLVSCGADPNRRFFVFFKTIAMPRLRTLSISADRPYIAGFGYEMASAFRRFLTSALPPLTSFSLSRVKLQDFDDLFTILRALSGTLSHLRLFNCDAADSRWDEFVRFLILPSQVLVNLEELEFDYLRWTQESDLLFFEMVRSRWMAIEPTKRLSSLRVLCQRVDVDTLRLGLRPFSDDGLRVHIALSESSDTPHEIWTL
ncbi:hypothetical protein E1B28_011813 [Marasmius oreades]|uniref:F-box domain-containing protein n=1 Tax=Marasmius oreades TaxID=181124 RepID=A0A9P7RV26_9AGAR|nr:uncharacterized protein E1B28_011813 [Marasmius oreades]KAG7090210.1 hypothetical protein E1B28_011813 [Marasmius oreades]